MELNQAKSHTSDTLFAFRGIFRVLKLLGFYPNSFKKSKSTWFIQNFLPLLIYTICSLITIKCVSRPIKLNVITVSELQQLALNITSMFYINLSVTIALVTIAQRKRIEKFFQKLISIDKRLRQLEAGINSKRFFRISIYFITFCVSMQVALNIVSSSIATSGKIPPLAVEVPMIVANFVVCTSYWCYMMLFILCTYALCLRLQEVNKVLRKQFLEKVKYEPFTQYCFVKHLAAIYGDVLDLVDILNDTYSILINGAVALSISFYIFMVSQVFHLSKDPQNFYVVLISIVWSNFSNVFIPLVFWAGESLTRRVSD